MEKLINVGGENVIVRGIILWRCTKLSFFGGYFKRVLKLVMLGNLLI